MNLRTIAGSLPFAHLAGLTRNAKKADDEDMRNRGESAERCDEDEEASAAAASENDDDQDDNDEDDKKETSKKSKKAKKAKKEKPGEDDDNSDGEDDDREDETDEDEEGKAKKAAAKARKAERARCASIFACDAAADNVRLAAKLAFTTDLSASAAIAILEESPAAAKGIHNRMARTEQARVGSGSGGEPNKEAAIAASWAEAAKDFQPAK